jgi:uncharacterized RDD family membrane protein YckC
LDAPELAALPWETMFDPERGNYICRSEPLIRHISVPTPAPSAFKPPLRVLGIIAAPRNVAQLDAQGERDRIDEALGALGASVEMSWAPSGAWAPLQTVLLEGPWHVVHYVGHSAIDPKSGEGTIGLEDSAGLVDWVRAERFAFLLSLQKPAPRLIVLNSCSSAESARDNVFSGAATALVRSGVSAVVAMQFAITDVAAKAFAAGFYQALATGRSISEAVRIGRISIAGTGDTLEWATPVLFERGDEAQDAALFDAGGSKTHMVSLEQVAHSATTVALYQHASKSVQVGDYATALETLDRLLKISPDYQDAQTQRDIARKHVAADAAYQHGVAALSRGFLQEAVDAFQETLRLLPDYPSARQSLDSALRRQSENTPPLPASLGARAVARTADWVIGWAALLLVLLVFPGALTTQEGGSPNGSSGSSTTAEFTTAGSIIASIVIAAVLATNICCVALKGWTLGMKMVGVTLVRHDNGGVPRWGRAFLRAVVQLLSWLMCVGPLLLAVSVTADPSRRQGWHDRAAGVDLVRLR